MNINRTIKGLDAHKRLSKNGVEYWMGREIQSTLGYNTWESFEKVIKKAIMTCESTGEETDHHFRETTKMMMIGKGGQRAGIDYFLDRYACYLISMNGDPSKIEIGTAQTYFAIQTRKQELQDQNHLINIQKRTELRDRVKSANKHLNNAAKQAGVQNYGLFHDAGYRGLYEMSLTEIKRKKRIEQKENLLDRVGRAELAANEFRITQTEEALVREKIQDEISAQNKHREIGQKVRKTIIELSGTLPENLPTEPLIKEFKTGKKQKQMN